MAEAMNVQALAGLGLQEKSLKTGACGQALYPRPVGGWSDQIIASAQQFENQENVVWVACEENLVIAIADTVRPEAARTITRLKQLGIQEMMLTGDNDLTARSIALEISIDQVYSELLPEHKVDVIRSLQREYQTVCNGGGWNQRCACSGKPRLGLQWEPQARGAGYRRTSC